MCIRDFEGKTIYGLKISGWNIQGKTIYGLKISGWNILGQAGKDIYM